MPDLLPEPQVETSSTPEAEQEFGEQTPADTPTQQENVSRDAPQITVNTEESAPGVQNSPVSPAAGGGAVEAATAPVGDEEVAESGATAPRESEPAPLMSSSQEEMFRNMAAASSVKEATPEPGGFVRNGHDDMDTTFQNNQ